MTIFFSPMAFQCTLSGGLISISSLPTSAIERASERAREKESETEKQRDKETERQR